MKACSPAWGRITQSDWTGWANRWGDNTRQEGHWEKLHTHEIKQLTCLIKSFLFKHFCKETSSISVPIFWINFFSITFSIILLLFITFQTPYHLESKISLNLFFVSVPLLCWLVIIFSSSSNRCPKFISSFQCNDQKVRLHCQKCPQLQPHNSKISLNTQMNTTWFCFQNTD